MPVNNAKEAIDFVRNARRIYQNVRSAKAINSILDQCMYMGMQWVTTRPDVSSSYSADFLTRLNTWTDIDRGKLRVTCNRIASQIQKVAAATYPSHMGVACYPLDRDIGTVGTAKASVFESMLNLAVDDSDALRAVRDANFQRCITGEWVVGMTINQADGGSIETFSFDPYLLTLDPANLDKPLCQHDWVLYSDVWTYDKLKRVYPELAKNIDQSKLQKVGTLVPEFKNLYTITNRRMYSQYAVTSESKGVRVHQLHCKYGNRFDQMYVMVETPGDQFQVAYAGNTPFGGNGLPFAILTGHRAAGNYGFISDASMMKDDQDALNLIKTLIFRMLQAQAGWKWLVSRSALKPGVNEEDFARKFNNTVGGAIVLENGSKDSPGTAQLVQYPSPSPIVVNLAERQEQAIMERGHRYDINQGRTQSHVPNSTYRTALDQADQVLSQRVLEDIANLEPWLETMLGTYIALAQQQSPGVLDSLNKAGFDERDAVFIMEADPANVACKIKIRESSIRHRPHSERRSDLDSALMAQAITPEEYRRALASDLDTPVTQMDAYYQMEAERAASAILEGTPWQPIPLGRYSTLFIDQFRSALLSKQAKANPQIAQMLSMAIAQQTEAMVAEQMLATGQTMMPPVAPQATEAPMDDTANTLADLANVIGGQSPTVVG